MSSTLAAFFAGALVVGWAATVHAQAEPPGTAPETAPTADEGAYATELNLRPLTMPAGVVEAGAQFRTLSYGREDSGIDIFDYVYTDLRARGGAGPVEVFVEADLLVEAPSSTTVSPTTPKSSRALATCARSTA